MDEQLENRRILIDTSILIDYYRKKDKEKTLLYKLIQNYKLSISTITEFEYIVGFQNKDLDFGYSFLKFVEILDFDSNCVKASRRIYNDLKKENKLIELPDIFIAATALSNNLKLATFNIQHFERIKELNLIKSL